MDEAKAAGKSQIYLSVAASQGERMVAFLEIADTDRGWVLGMIGTNEGDGTDGLAWILDAPFSEHAPSGY